MPRVRHHFIAAVLGALSATLTVGVCTLVVANVSHTVARGSDDKPRTVVAQSLPMPIGVAGLPPSEPGLHSLVVATGVAGVTAGIFLGCLGWRNRRFGR